MLATGVACIPLYLISSFIYTTIEAEQNQWDKINTQIVFLPLGWKNPVYKKMILYINICGRQKRVKKSLSFCVNEQK